MTLEVLKSLGGALAVAGPIIGLFEWAEKGLKRERATELWQWVQGGGIEVQVAAWPRLFVAMFDGLFGDSHLSPRCFLRSAIMSVVVVAALTLFWFSGADEADRAYFWSSELLYFVPVIVAVNVVPDYLSLLQTRGILHVMSATSRAGTLIALLALDLVASMAITFLVGGVLRGVVSQFGQGVFEPLDLVTAWPIDIAMLFFGYGAGLESSRGMSIGVFVYSALWTSVWVWLFAGASMFARGRGRITALRTLVFRWVKVEETPYRAIGVIATIIAVLGYAVISLLRYLVSVVG